MLLLLLACTTQKPYDSDSPPALTWDDTPLPTEVIGEIEAVENPTWKYSRVSATLRAGPLPTTQVVVATEGDCSVLDGALTDGWLCTPECTWGAQSCIDGACVDWPAMAPAGDITLTGLTPGTATLEVLDLGYYGTPSGFSGELFGPGDRVSLTSPGGDTPALSMAALGVADADFTWTPIDPGEDMEITWTPSDGPSRVELRLETGWHGASALTTIWCETEDDGELTVPASLTSWFEIPSCGECEMSTARRFTRDVLDFGAGPITFLVASETSFVAWWGP